MKRIPYSKSPGIPHGTMDEDFLTHKNCSEWRYATGCLNDEAGNMFCSQFTLAWVNILGLRLHMLLASLTDFRTAKRYNSQDPVFLGRNRVTKADTVAPGDKAAMRFEATPLPARAACGCTSTGRASPRM